MWHTAAEFISVIDCGTSGKVDTKRAEKERERKMEFFSAVTRGEQQWTALYVGCTVTRQAGLLLLLLLFLILKTDPKLIWYANLIENVWVDMEKALSQRREWQERTGKERECGSERDVMERAKKWKWNQWGEVRHAEEVCSAWFHTFKVRELPVNHTGVVSQMCIISGSSLGVAAQS